MSPMTVREYGELVAAEVVRREEAGVFPRARSVSLPASAQHLRERGVTHVAGLPIRIDKGLPEGSVRVEVVP